MQWQVLLVVERIHLEDDGLGIEAQARRARYQVFAQTLLSGEVLMIAQHLGNQREILLLTSRCGSGPAGLLAIGENTPFAEIQLIRPLLAQTREVLETWARQHELCWIEDESNQDDTYDRNFLRLRVTLLLQRRWLHFMRAIARSAVLCVKQESLLDELLTSDLANCITAHGTLLLVPLMMMGDARRAALLRRWLAGSNASIPSRDGLECTWQGVVLAREDASSRFRLGEYEARRYQSQLWWAKSADGQSETVTPWLEWKTSLVLPAGLGSVQLISVGELRILQAGEAVGTRFKTPGLLCIVRRDGGWKLKKIWQEQGISS